MQLEGKIDNRDHYAAAVQTERPDAIKPHLGLHKLTHCLRSTGRRGRVCAKIGDKVQAQVTQAVVHSHAKDSRKVAGLHSKELPK